MIATGVGREFRPRPSETDVLAAWFVRCDVGIRPAPTLKTVVAAPSRPVTTTGTARLVE